ncbi:uncharacterized protein CANTADRAFT_71918 [Suhomyces tanzawaensis NRRL Y-17324]|uniref:Uncharacterized protein n=1 Tax=Suhomyces tanzawaensis NRRL Y-17324 TaxID=984487 RepID=A0A1E4SBH9_9ASCO|nr:uncharacterized protein CANTADRAFT_71918 [Suhomyces tanzawaensis NRRL Y-17324]ODV76752.1 hypothetical protein CANTADRAFT_71918 [Suhomyces tanzawaensis NRRL Y-17324]
MTETTPPDHLAMFFDNEYDPEAYVDTLFQMSTTTRPTLHHQNRGLGDLSNQISGLITHLDFYTNELSRNLREKLDTLKTNTNNLVGEHEVSTNSTTRLQYYVNVLNNAILSLQTELSLVVSEMNSEAKDDDSSVENLRLLKLVKANLTQVLSIFEFVNNTVLASTNGTPNDSLTVEQFEGLLNEFHASTKKLADLPNPKPILDLIDKLIEIGNLFNNLNKFRPLYKQFLTRITAEREAYKEGK